MTATPNKKVVFIAGTGTSGIEQVNVVTSFTGPTGGLAQWTQLAGFTGPTGTFKNVQKANTSGATGTLKTVVVAGFVDPNDAAPVLTLMSATQTGQTTASLSVTTDHTGGTLYTVVSTSATPPTATQIKAGQDQSGSAAPYAGSNASPVSGSNAFSATGLTANTTYYAYFLHHDSFGLDSTVYASSSTTTLPNPATLSLPTLVDVSGTVMTAGATSNLASGTLYFVVTTNSSTPTAAQIIAGHDQGGGAAAFAGSVSAASGVNTISATGLTASTAYYSFAAQSSTGGSSNVVGAGPVSTSADPAAAFLARTSGLDATHTNAYTALINGLVTDSVWSKLDVLHIYATADSTTALLNLCSTSFNGTSHGSPSFTADRGFTGSSGSSTVFIDTGFNPASGSPQFVQNSAHHSVWNLSAFDTDVPGPIGHNSAANAIRNQLMPRYTGDGNAYFVVNSAGAAAAVAAQGAQTGHYLGNRSSSSAVQGYKAGSSIATNNSSTSASPPNNNFYSLAGNNNGAAIGSPMQLACISIGASLSSTDVTNFYNRLRTYMTAVGVP